ncbi:hypothetical protein Tco_0128089 [Tanacetum coccineum]
MKEIPVIVLSNDDSDAPVTIKRRRLVKNGTTMKKNYVQVETKANEHNTLLKKGRIGNNTYGYMSFLANKKVSAITNKKPTEKEFQNIEYLETNDGNTIGFNNNQKKELCFVLK